MDTTEPKPALSKEEKRARRQAKLAKMSPEKRAQLEARKSEKKAKRKASGGKGKDPA